MYTVLSLGIHVWLVTRAAAFCKSNKKFKLNKDQSSNIIADKALRVSFYSFKVYLKNRIVGTYKELCEIANCHVCNIVKNA